jgi:uncharacterized membrane protein YdjX (TVP38/TMEM64 family)
MNPEAFFSLAIGVVGFVLFGQVIRGHDPFPSETRGKRRFNSFVIASTLVIFLAQTILRSPPIPPWAFFTSATGLILGIGSALLALRNPGNQPNSGHDV